MPRTGRDERGFSLIELLIALTVTLLVAGAVYGLLTTGSSAFRREPALADRQQNIRLAMDIISRDVYQAGRGLPQFAQAFTDDLDAQGPLLGSGGSQSDLLEIFSTQDCPHTAVCAISTMGTGASVTTSQMFSACYTWPTLVVLGDDAGKWGVFWGEGGGTSAACGGTGGTNGHFRIPPGQAPLYNPPGGLGGWVPDYMSAGQVTRYRIRADADGTPNLERSPIGGQLRPDGTESWEILARGIEDLQVEYLTGAGWNDTPGTVACAAGCAAPTQTEYDTIVRRVRITLSARALEPNLQGQTTSAVGNAPRGQLVTEVAPRAAAATLALSTGEM